MNENTKIITNLAIAIMKSKRERDQLERKTKEPHSRRRHRRCKGEAKGCRRKGEMKGRKLKRRQWRAKSLPTELNHRDR